jgi:riboflavin kinase/FMN adenylyltransferase
MFDGLHKGHQYFLKEFVNLADQLSLTPILICMYPHPRKFLHDIELKCLTSFEEKEEKLKNIGIENFLLLETSKELLSLTSESFLTYLTSSGINIKAVVMGFNNCIGRPVKDEKSLSEIVSSLGMEFYRIPASPQKLSSTLIRQALNNGNIEYANSMLGYCYSVYGDVVSGNRIGRQIGFPTANIHVDSENKLIPAVGVYAVTLHVESDTYYAMMNIGYRPTIKEEIKDLFLEVHVLDKDLDLYNQRIEVQFYKRIRDEQRFNSLNELKIQLLRDKDFIKKYFHATFVASKNEKE